MGNRLQMDISCTLLSMQNLLMMLLSMENLLMESKKRWDDQIKYILHSRKMISEQMSNYKSMLKQCLMKRDKGSL